MKNTGFRLPINQSPNLDLLFAQQLEAAHFCENYAKLYFDAKHMAKRLLNRRW